ncbi:MAG: transketolase [Acidobacteria bacterium]|nr:transketolase [Acidobacteriota bacterium]
MVASEMAVLKEQIRNYRIDIIKMLHRAGSGHPGGSLSAIDIIATLYHHEMKHDPKRPEWPDRDVFVMSKGHGVPAQYAVMAGMGYFPKDELATLRQINSRLQGHPSVGFLPGIEASTGSLGMGLSFAAGVALAAKMDGKANRVYCIMGDGETQEGQVWEAALAAPKFKLDNLVGIVDYNKGQIDGPTSEVMDLEPIADKWKAFNWHTIVIDGHDLDAIHGALQEARNTKGKPTMIVAHTVKGKGVSFMEGVIDWHGAAPNDAQTEQALAELEGAQS